MLSRLIATDDGLWELLEDTMNRLLIPASGVIADAFGCYDPVPFGLVEDEFIKFVIDQFNRRSLRVQKAHGAGLVEIERLTFDVLEQEKPDLSTASGSGTRTQKNS